MTHDTLPAKVVREGGTVMTFDEPRRAFKKVGRPDSDRDGYVCTLLVPEGARVVYPVKPSGSWNNEHLRVEEAIVDDIEGDRTEAYAATGTHFRYAEGERAVPDDFCADPSVVSAPGIHCFAVRTGAEHW